VVILYLETNFLMSLALNQDPDAFALLEKAAQDRSLKLAIPQVCFMEAFATIRNRIENASVHPSEVNAFLSGNHRDFGTQVVQKALKAAGIEKYFAEARNFLGWYGSLPH